MKARRVVLCGAMLLALWAGPALGAADPRSIDWSRILDTLGSVLDARRESPIPTPERSSTLTPTATATATPTASATPTWTRTQPRAPTATFTATRKPTNTATLVPTSTDTPLPTSTWTETPRPTATRTPTKTSPPQPSPTSSTTGQIAFAGAVGRPPAQRLASAFLVFPYIVSEGSADTRIELVNMSNQEQSLSCFYVRQADCAEVGFFVTLTANQPLSWLASEGTNNPLTFTAVPPFDGVGELKCAAMPRMADLAYHNVAQGRAIAFDRDDGETVGYGAIGFQRLVPGSFTGVISLDGSTYEQCPDRLHFQVLTRQSGGGSSELVLVPCQQDLFNQLATEATVQLAIISEFEQVFSSSFRFTCHDTRSFSRISTLSKALLGSDTAHLVVRGVQSPLIGLVIDRFEAIDSHTAANSPFLEGGRSSTVFFP